MTRVFFHLKQVSNSGYKILLCALACVFIFIYLFIYSFFFPFFLSFNRPLKYHGHILVRGLNSFTQNRAKLLYKQETIFKQHVFC
jgi:hypothetical protein